MWEGSVACYQTAGEATKSLETRSVVQDGVLSTHKTESFDNVIRAGFCSDMEQSTSLKSETDLKKSFANGNARNGLQSAGNNAVTGKFFIESIRSREIC